MSIEPNQFINIGRQWIPLSFEESEPFGREGLGEPCVVAVESGRACQIGAITSAIGDDTALR